MFALEKPCVESLRAIVIIVLDVVVSSLPNLDLRPMKLD